jgi:hypothetical protein
MMLKKFGIFEKVTDPWRSRLPFDDVLTTTLYLAENLSIKKCTSTCQSSENNSNDGGGGGGNEQY